ncbi:MAG: M1 family metallopeptidase [Ilumatobacteraceae bacterium]
MTTADAPVLDPYRLPRAVVPARYDVELAPDLAAATFTGQVRIAVDVTEPVEELVLNAVDLEIAEVRVDDREAAWSLQPETERLMIRPADRLEAGQVEVAISFTGILNDKLRGFYRSTFRDDDGTEHVIATTQMESTDCRRAFPCWDEPDFKAVFGITLIVDDDLLAVSNGPEVERRAGPTDGKVTIRFADTMVMSTYLVAFVVGPLVVTDPVDVDGVPLRIVHVPGKGHLTGAGLDIGAFALRWFQDYYGIPYPSDKVDLLALPDFAAGAMENLGCITFRENLLLLDPATSTQAEQQNIADVVAHELAHMWFGDLVTMRWWNGIWLNEAFATFMELAACDAYKPEWGRWTLFGLERSAAFETDSLRSTRPVEYEVRSPQDCEGMFDVLTYQKGGALLRMLEPYLGEDRFQAGVSHYLRTHEYANTETNDLWDAIEETTGDPVRRMMDSWIWQPGYPLVRASLDGQDLVLRQQRFAYDDATLEADESPTTWLVPVQVRTGERSETVLLDGLEARLTLHDPAAPVVVNAGGHGFYRVSYDATLRGRISGEVLGSLGTLERYNLVDDAWNEVVAGRLPAAEFLAFVEGFGGEDELAVWQAIVIGLRGLGRLLDDADLPAFQLRVRALLGPVVTRLGEPVDGEDDLRAKLRGLLTAALAIQGADDSTREWAADAYRRSEESPASVDPELVAAATSIVASTADDATFETLVDGFRHGATPQDQLRHLFALAEVDSNHLLLRACEFAMGGEVKTQNAPFLLRMCMANRRHGAAAWRFVRQRWDEANERFPSNTIVRMVDSVKTLTDPSVAADVQAFFAEHPIEQAAKTLDQILERQRVNVALRQREHARLAAALVTA